MLVDTVHSTECCAKTYGLCLPLCYGKGETIPHDSITHHRMGGIEFSRENKESVKRRNLEMGQVKKNWRGRGVRSGRKSVSRY